MKGHHTSSYTGGAHTRLNQHGVLNKACVLQPTVNNMQVGGSSSTPCQRTHSFCAPRGPRPQLARSSTRRAFRQPGPPAPPPPTPCP
jgi:hypothetical protein